MPTGAGPPGGLHRLCTSPPHRGHGEARARGAGCSYDRRVSADPPFISYAQNREDVVLWRALGDVARGRYVEVGANHPTDDSVSKAFYDRGWSGITVEPVPYFADLQRAQRPRDHLVQAAVTDSPDTEITLHTVPGTGLSTIVDEVSDRHAGAGIEHLDVTVPAIRLDDVLTKAGWVPEEPIHFMLVDVEGAEDEVLRSIDLRVWRPWVLVVESTAPNSTVSTHESWEPDVLAAGYDFRLFDGLSRFYVSRERAAERGELLTYAACVLDNYVAKPHADAQEERQELRVQVAHWRTIALTQWADAVVGAVGRAPIASSDAEAEHLRHEIQAIQGTLSWRVTRPLRGLRRVAAAVRRA
ncbi:MAG: FkbM family methyltransferase [Actinotalea sp.]|nr:FkbM family methyltransferase [Actinotalea sp.]